MYSQKGMENNEGVSISLKSKSILEKKKISKTETSVAIDTCRS